MLCIYPLVSYVGILLKIKSHHVVILYHRGFVYQGMYSLNDVEKAKQDNATTDVHLNLISFRWRFWMTVIPIGYFRLCLAWSLLYMVSTNGNDYQYPLGVSIVIGVIGAVLMCCVICGTLQILMQYSTYL